MKITGVHHSCVIVSDMARSLVFYRDVLGMREDVNVHFDADPIMMGLPGTKPKQHIVMLSAGNTNVELIHYLEPKGRTTNESRTCDGGTLHICFQVSDIQASYEELKAKGVKFHGTPSVIDKTGAGLAGYGYVYFRGPDNEVLEFMQPPE